MYNCVGSLPTEYNELKTELSDFLRDFAQQGQVRIISYKTLL